MVRAGGACICLQEITKMPNKAVNQKLTKNFKTFPLLNDFTLSLHTKCTLSLKIAGILVITCVFTVLDFVARFSVC